MILVMMCMMIEGNVSSFTKHFISYFTAETFSSMEPVDILVLISSRLGGLSLDLRKKVQTLI